MRSKPTATIAVDVVPCTRRVSATFKGAAPHRFAAVRERILSCPIKGNNHRWPLPGVAVEARREEAVAANLTVGSILIEMGIRSAAQRPSETPTAYFLANLFRRVVFGALICFGSE